MICDKLNVALDDLEGGGSKFLELIQGTEWEWLCEPFQGGEKITEPYIRAGGPLKLVLELDHYLRAVRLGSLSYVGELRRCFTELSQVPSMARIGITPGRYAQVVHKIVGFLERGDWSVPWKAGFLNNLFLNNLTASYLLTSMKSSWCLVREASDDMDQGNSLTYDSSGRAWSSIIRTPTLFSARSRESSQHVQLIMDLGPGEPVLGGAFLTLGIFERGSSNPLAYDGLSQTLLSVHDDLPIQDMPNLDNLLRECGLWGNLPNNYAMTLSHMIQAIARYVRWYGLHSTECMPLERMPPLPMWVSQGWV